MRFPLPSSGCSLPKASSSAIQDWWRFSFPGCAGGGGMGAGKTSAIAPPGMVKVDASGSTAPRGVRS
eukprot:3332479-Alexandrium_andersonii.AAC.1